MTSKLSAPVIARAGSNTESPKTRVKGAEMEPCTHTTAPLTTMPLPSSAPLAGLTDAELLTATRRLVGRSNQLLASLLAHLAEVESRGMHRVRDRKSARLNS